MAFKLKNLKVKKVDFVDEGANPDAHIRLFKRKEEETEEKTNNAGDPATKEIGLARKFISFFSKLLDIDGDDSITEEDLSEAARAAKAEKEAKEKVTGTDEKPEPETDTNNNLKGVEKMNFDKSKMTPEELETLEELEKKYGVTKSDEESENDAGEAEEQETKEDAALEDEACGKTVDDDGEDVDKKNYIHPDVKAQLEELKKFKEAAEEKELLEVAKKYEIIGKKPEELVTKFKTLKAAGGTAYDDMISILDESVELVEKSGLFSEIGKSGHGSFAGSAEATARNKAVELMKTRTELTMAQAIDEVLAADPELRARYEEED